MNFLNIEYFLAAAKELNFTKAAEKLYISPQSLSNHIAKLENELGVELFYRDHPMRLTYAGEVLVRNGQAMLDKKNQTLEELRDIGDLKRGRLSIGISHTRGRVFMPIVLPEFNEKYSGVEITLLEAPTSRLDVALANGEIDLMISLLPFSNVDVASVELCREEILLLIPDRIVEEYFDGDIDSLSDMIENKNDLSVLKNCPFLMMHTENRVRNIADKLLSEHGVKPDILLEVENIETILALCGEGMGITFYPSSLHTYSTEKKFRGLHALRMNYDIAHSAIGVGYMKNRFLSQAAKNFIRILKEKI